LTDVYQVAGISKQAVHKRRTRQLQKANDAIKIFEGADAIRKEHPRVGCRKMARQLINKGWGRDKIEEVLLGNGYRVKYRRLYKRTTYSQHQLYFPNLIEGLELDNINKVIQTDITYYRVKDKFYYLVFIIDVYSKQIVGYACSKSLDAEANIKALKRMLRLRGEQSIAGLIHHSDRGSQYIDKEYLKLLTKNEIAISMCTMAWENPFAERINRTIKDEYLDGWQINDYASLSRSVRKAVNHYNRKRQHDNLNKQSPVEFEKKLLNTNSTEREILKLHTQSDSYPQKNVNGTKKKEAKKKGE
jgi:transposase InsO family protein